MNVLSLFDGMSCGQIALERAGFKVDNYYASEIDKYAIAVTQKNYPDTIQLGDITKWQEWDIEQPDIIMGGSPCQGFSFAGKQLNFEDERSKLFFVFVDILKHYKPKYFLLENVIMKQEHIDVISGILGEIYPECITQQEIFRSGRLEPIKINSALVSAQNRKRLYWTNIEGIEQPEDRLIVLKDIIQTDVTFDNNRMVDISVKHNAIITNTNPSGNGINGNVHNINREKSPTLTTNKGEGIKVGCIQVGVADLNGNDQIKRVYSPEGKSPTLTTMGGGNQEPEIAIIDDLYKDREGRVYTEKSPTIRSGRSGLNVAIIPEATKKGYIEANPGDGVDLTYPDSKTRRGRLMRNKCNALMAGNAEYGVIDQKLSWRKLTPIECERLQTVDDNYTDCVSNSQRYKMLGNGWTVDVITHIFSYLDL